MAAQSRLRHEIDDLRAVFGSRPRHRKAANGDSLYIKLWVARARSLSSALRDRPSLRERRIGVYAEIRKLFLSSVEVFLLGPLAGGEPLAQPCDGDKRVKLFC